jgi:hypothetical protein
MLRRFLSGFRVVSVGFSGLPLAPVALSEFREQESNAGGRIRVGTFPTDIALTTPP